MVAKEREPPVSSHHSLHIVKEFESDGPVCASPVIASLPNHLLVSLKLSWRSLESEFVVLPALYADPYLAPHTAVNTLLSYGHARVVEP